MARILNSFPETTAGRRFRGDPQWFNGQVWELDWEADLSAYNSMATAYGSIIQYARKLGLKIRSRRPNNTTMVIQAFKPEETA